MTVAHRVFPIQDEAYAHVPHDGGRPVPGSLCTPSGIANWRGDWTRATKRAADALAIVSAYSLDSPTRRLGGLDQVVAERQRKGEVFEP